MSATGRSRVRQANDFYATPAWCTAAVLPHVAVPGFVVLDPACGTGAILDVCAQYGHGTVGMELENSRAVLARVKGHEVRTTDALLASWPDADGVVMNPPYAAAMPFVERALRWSGGRTVAALLRLNWLGGQKRAAFHRANPADVYVLPRRPSFTGSGTDATEYAWFVWGLGRGGLWRVLEAASR